MTNDKLTLYKQSGKTGELTVDLSDIYSENLASDGFSLCDDSTTWATVYMGPNSSGVPSGYIFHIDNITLTNTSGTGGAALARLRTATDGSDFWNAIVGASETFYVDGVKGLNVNSGAFIYGLISGGGVTTYFHLGGRLRPQDSWGQ